MGSRSFRFASAAWLLTLGLALPSGARAAVVWTSTFEKGDASEWMPGTNPKGPDGVRKNFEVLSEQVYRGKFAGKITVHPDDLFGQYKQDRVDIQHQSTLTDEGKNSWLSGHYLMPEDAKVRNEIAFFESNVSYQNVMDFWVEPKSGGGTTINFGVGFLGATKLWSADFTKAVWHQIAIHVLWSQNAQTGSVDVWFDGQQVVTGAKAKTKADGNTLFFQTGLHRKDPANFDDTIYFDQFVEADAMADAAIAAPSPDPAGAGGGSAGAGGAAGAGGGATAGASGSSSSLGGASNLGGTGGVAGNPSGGGANPNAGSPNAGTFNGTAGTSSNAGASSNAAAPADSSGCALAVQNPARGTGLACAAAALSVLLLRRRHASR